jgi:hypothetical protein
MVKKIGAWTERGSDSGVRKSMIGKTYPGNLAMLSKAGLLLTLILGVLLLASASVQAQSLYYVHAGATGNKSGLDWKNAYTALPSSLLRGAIYYIAGGVYPGATFGTPASGSQLITIKKATVSDHGTNTGWSNDYATQVVFKGAIRFNTSYWVFDGVTGGGPGSWTSGYGFYIDRTGGADTSGVLKATGVNNVTVRHVEIEGHGDDGATYSQDGINLGTGDGPVTVSYVYIHKLGRCPIFNRSHNTTWEYIYTGKFESVSAQHSEIASMWISVTAGADPVKNTTVRWSILTWAEGTGGFIGEWDGAYIYGNVFVKLNGSEFSNGGNGLVGSWSKALFKNVKIYNNTFLGTSRPIVVHSIGTAGGGVGNTARNNLFYKTSALQWGIGGVNDHDYNEYIETTANAYGPNDSFQNSNPYPNYFTPYGVPPDLAMSRNTEPGQNLGSPYNVDMFGNTRTTWTRGAIEYASGTISSLSPPLAPSRLVIIDSL